MAHINLDLLHVPEMQKVIQMLKDMFVDNRLDYNVRLEYAKQLKEVMQWGGMASTLMELLPSTQDGKE